MRAWYWGFYKPQAVCLTNTRARAFVAGGGDEGVVAVDGIRDLLRGVWRDTGYPVGLFADSASDKLYCAMEGEFVALVCVIDPWKNNLLATLPLTDYPGAVAFNTVDHKVYVSASRYGGDAHTIAVLDAAGDSLLTEIAVEGAKDFLAYDADDDLLFAADYHSHQVLAFDGKADCVVDSFWVDELPTGLLYNAAQHRLYCFGNKGEVTVVTPRVHGQDNYMSVGAGLQSYVLDNSGARLYGSSPDRNSVYVIDCVGESLACAVPVFAPPVALSYDSQHDRLYCAYGEEGSGISVIDCSRRIVRAIIPVDAQRLYWDYGTDAVYCLSDSGVTVIDGETRRVVATLKMDWPSGVASAPGWPRVYVADHEDPCLTILRTDPEPQAQATADAQATVVRGRLDWTGTLAVMYDKGGRRVADVHRGGNDVSGLRPGVYFIRQSGVRPGTYARKVVVTR